MNILKNGTVIKSRYKIVRPILQSRFKNAYYAQDLHLKDKFWLVNEIPFAAKHPREKEKNNNDLKVFSSYLHPNLTSVIDFFEENNNFYIISEYLKGKNLENIIQNQQTVLNEADLVKIGIQLADILNYLNLQKMPASFYGGIRLKNLILTNAGILKLANLELEVFLPHQEGVNAKTQNGGMEYLPPEQFSKVPALDQKSLVFILGAVLYHVASKTSPTDNLSKLKPLHEINPKISEEFSGIIQKATKINPEERYLNLKEFKNILAKTTKISPKNKKQNNMAIIFIILAIIICTLTAIGIIFYFFSK